MAEYVFCDDPSGGVGMRISAKDQTELFNATATALCLYMWDTDAVVERERITVASRGFNEKTALVGLLSELLFRMETDAWVFKRFELVECAPVDGPEGLRRRQLRTSGVAFGERHDPARHTLIRPVNAVRLPGLRLTKTEQGFHFYCVLDA